MIFFTEIEKNNPKMHMEANDSKQPKPKQHTGGKCLTSNYTIEIHSNKNSIVLTQKQRTTAKE
jgi:hypothetical protein